ncbi:MAG: hypothetical protein KBH93_00305 [Anaerolineae bacterium]|nr:hypothetical protein [Anaerolineae bacterium]
MRRVILYLAVLLFVTCPTVMQATAQDSLSSHCSSQDMVAAIEAVEDVLARAKQAATDGDVTTALDLLAEASLSVTATQAQCRGWYFEGDGSDVLGPLDLDGGMYILEYASSVGSALIAGGMLTIEFESVDGSETIRDQVMELRMEAGDFSGRKTIRLDGGRYVISVQLMYLSDWTIQLVKP